MSKEVIVSDGELPGDVLAAVQAGRKVEAIKRLREATGIGLANAKVLVDRAALKHGPQKPIRSFDDPAPDVSGLLKLLALVVLLAGAYLYRTAA